MGTPIVVGQSDVAGVKVLDEFRAGGLRAAPFPGQTGEAPGDEEQQGGGQDADEQSASRLFDRLTGLPHGPSSSPRAVVLSLSRIDG
jgi:hypothetical protein